MFSNIADLSLCEQIGAATTIAYSVPSANVQHGGRYVLEITSSTGRITSIADVFVNAEPTVIIAQGAQITTSDAMIEITCEAQGFPPPIVEWSSNDRVLAKTSYGSTTNGQHKIKSILTHLIYSVEGVKSYKCTGQNKLGSATATVKVTTTKKKLVLEANKNKYKSSQDYANNTIPIIIAVISGMSNHIIMNNPSTKTTWDIFHIFEALSGVFEI